MTTPRENLLKVYGHQEPDWVPVVTLGDGYNRPIHLPSSFYEETTRMSPFRALSRYFDADVLDRVYVHREVFHNVTYTKTVDGSLETERWETPGGDLTRVVKKMGYSVGDGSEPDLVSWARIENPVKSAADFEALASVFDDMTYEFDGELAARTMQSVGDTGIVTLGAPSTPLGMCIRMYLGVEATAIAYKEHHSEFRDLLAVMGDNYLRCYRGLAELDGDGTINYDDTTTMAISPQMFRELEIPFLNQTADILHEAGKLCIHHACGHVAQLLEDFRGTRIDGFDGPAAPPVGNTTVARAREGLGPDVVIMPFTEEFAMKSNDPATVRGAIRTMFEEAGSPTNFIVNVASPPGVPVESLWLAIDEAKRLSRTFF
jgi:hypothetical protein